MKAEVAPNTMKKRDFQRLEFAETLSEEQSLKHHTKKEHNQRTKYSCSSCSWTFGSCLKFRTHCFEEHGITHPFQCVDCEKKYTNESAMKVHRRTHVNQRPFHCNHCDRNFIQSSTFQSHMQRHSGKTPYNCSVCEKSFATKGDLRTHSHIHKTGKQFTCDVCEKNFPRKANLIRHFRKHSGEKPYACEYCSKCFARNENRQEHQRTHTNERPYICEICGASFSDSGNFCTHKKIHGETRAPPKKTSVKKRGTDDACVLKIEQFHINLVRKPFQLQSLEKFTTPNDNPSLPIAYLPTSPGVNVKNDDKGVSEDISLATTPEDELIMKDDKNIECYESATLDTDILSPLALGELNLPILCESQFQVLPNPSHLTKFNPYLGNLWSTSLTNSNNLAFADNCLCNDGNVDVLMAHSPIGDFSLDINKFLNNDYFLDADRKM